MANSEVSVSKDTLLIDICDDGRFIITFEIKSEFTMYQLDALRLLQ